MYDMRSREVISGSIIIATTPAPEIFEPAVIFKLQTVQD